MLFHMSIAARDPRRVAAVFAEFWQGAALPFPPISDNGWIALAGDDRGSAIEVYPIDIVLREGDGDSDAHGVPAAAAGYSATHVAIATTLDRQAVLAIAAREGWPAKFRRRGGLFAVIEIWIEGRQMIEVLTPEMQADYVAGVTIAGWSRMVGAAALTPLPA